MTVCYVNATWNKRVERIEIEAFQYAVLSQKNKNNFGFYNAKINVNLKVWN